MRLTFKPQRNAIYCLMLGLALWQPLSVWPAHNAVPQADCPAPTLQERINNAPAGGTINLPACTFTESVTINKNLTIIGTGRETTILQAPSNQRVIKVDGAVTLDLRNLTVTGGNALLDSGGGVYIPDGTLHASNVHISGNSASFGGGIFQGNADHSVEIYSSQIDNNHATAQHGGGVYANGNVILEDTDFTANTSIWHGGGLTVWSGNTNIQGGIFSNNSAANGNGGAVNVNNGLTVTGTQFIGNTARDNGGAVLQWNAGNQIQISNVFFQGNSAKIKGGAVYVNSVVTFDHDTFDANVVDSGNSTNTYGGGVYAGNTGNVSATSAVTVLDSVFSANMADCTGCTGARGGGIYIENQEGAGKVDKTTIISRSTFDRNDSWLGGGVFPNYQKLMVDHSSFTNNTGGYGGGVFGYIVEGEALLFQGNHTRNGSAGLSAYDLTLKQSRFLDNIGDAADNGSALGVETKVNLTNVLLAGNRDNPKGVITLGRDPTGSLTGIFNNVTISQSARGTGKAIIIHSGSSLHLTNSIITNFGTGVDVYGTLTEDYNLFYNNTSDANQEIGGSWIHASHDVFANPMFVNPAIGNYHLQVTSPAIAGGLYTGGVEVDLDYRPRNTVRSAMGAYNFWLTVFIPVIKK